MPTRLFSAAVALLASQGVQASSCPGSPVALHARCELTVTFQNPCSDVHDEILARIQGSMNGTWTDPHNGGNYTLLSDSDTLIDAQRHVGAGHGDYKPDKFGIGLTSNGDSCDVDACSESQILSVEDFSTNYCNTFNLFCGTDDGCKPLEHDLSSTITVKHCKYHDQTQCLK
eukprot:CAMPEP_0195518182 /NCGR_PEP_ID=MMETSP0794_2-20130614/12500_1 /TAXON_ID=515487 /ORGANISM="Stephanopyxis turris, Strain CCMP 815" /LENGTH=171 /DNA_ID=CAMNT_0040647107 /DNA_START=50 /DNA_END=565 /DNA_ORIENTATION=+